MEERTLLKPYTKYRLHVHKITRMHNIRNNEQRSFMYLFSFNKNHYPHLGNSRSLLFLTHLANQLQKLSLAIFCLTLI